MLVVEEISYITKSTVICRFIKPHFFINIFRSIDFNFLINIWSMNFLYSIDNCHFEYRGLDWNITMGLILKTNKSSRQPKYHVWGPHAPVGVGSATWHAVWIFPTQRSPHRFWRERSRQGSPTF